MTPGARVAAAIDILDDVMSGEPPERVLTRWGRQNRYAGSKDRAAVRDHVFDVLRRRRIVAHLGGGTSGRRLMIGMLKTQGTDPASLFTGEGHAPSPLTQDEAQWDPPEPSKAVRWNLPDWIVPEFERSLNEKAEDTALALQSRAPVVLRVNTARCDAANAIASLAEDGIDVEPNELSDAALTVTSGERRIRQSVAYQSGLVELQDASSQAVVDLLPNATHVLDYCAGGGGKALAIAARFGGTIFAHDIDPKRMIDIPNRARRANANIRCLDTKSVDQHAPYDLVLCDAPCSGSGAWRRSPDGKWSLTQQKLTQLTTIQDAILDTAKHLVKPGGTLAYATCSVLRCENEDRVDAFLNNNSGWAAQLQKRFDVTPSGDGFFVTHLRLNRF